jgi:hypothetical protein
LFLTSANASRQQLQKCCGNSYSLPVVLVSNNPFAEAQVQILANTRPTDRDSIDEIKYLASDAIDFTRTRDKCKRSERELAQHRKKQQMLDDKKNDVLDGAKRQYYTFRQYLASHPWTREQSFLGL